MKLLIIILGLLLAGCGSDSNVQPEPTTESVQSSVIFLQAGNFDGETTSMNAELIGELVIIDDCIRINELDSDFSYLPIWDAGFELREINNKFQILNEQDKVVAQVGDHMRLSGGETPTLSQLLQDKLPEDCSGPYWSVGNEVTVIP